MTNNDAAKTANSLVPPPTSQRTVLIVEAVGAGTALVAALTGLIAPLGDAASSTDYVNGFRVILSIVAMIVAGAGLTLRPGWFVSWLLASGTCLIARFGFPSSWDSFRMVAGAFAGVSFIGAGMAALPFGWRITVASIAAICHFGGIFNAVVMPPSTPDWGTYVWVNIYRPYLTFVYLNNAYQFYSPDPGPASELWFCVYYKTGPGDPVFFEQLQPSDDSTRAPAYKLMTDEDGIWTGKPIQDANGEPVFVAQFDKNGHQLERPKLNLDGYPDYVPITKWYKIPKRPRDYRDPLGQEYYRRLSLTENASNFTPLSQMPPTVSAEIQQRRVAQPKIPLIPNNPNQYCHPGVTITNTILPPYVRHVAHEFKMEGRPITSIKVYRVLHEIIDPREFVGESNSKKYRRHPYDINTYYPYYMGEFTPDGQMVKKNDPMLYWLVPINQRPEASLADFYNQDSRTLTLRDYERLYDDHVEKQARSNHMKGELK